MLGFVNFGVSTTTGYIRGVISVLLGLFSFGFVFSELEAVNVWPSKQDRFTPIAMIRTV